MAVRGAAVVGTSTLALVISADWYWRLDFTHTRNQQVDIFALCKSKQRCSFYISYMIISSPPGGRLLHREFEKRRRSDPTRLLSGSEVPQGENHSDTHRNTVSPPSATSSMCVYVCVNRRQRAWTTSQIYGGQRMRTSAALSERPSSPLVQTLLIIFPSFLFHYIVVLLYFPSVRLAGKKGYLAFQRMDQLYTEMEEEAYQNQETEITFL